MSQDDIGERGQWILGLVMTELCGRKEPIFRPRFLGDKHPTFDYMIELVDHPHFYFFVQVKATTQGYTKKDHRLKVQVSQRDVDLMVACPAPAYVVGIDTHAKLGFLLSVNEPRSRVPSLITDFQIDSTVLTDLAKEVQNYWTSRNMVLAGSKFKE